MAKEKATASGKGADFFLVKFWTQILADPHCHNICNWSPDGRYLIIYDTDNLMEQIKARSVCKQKDYDSFARQLRIYRWGRVRVDDTGAQPWPSEAKVWRHPKLDRESPLDEVANITRNAPPKPNRAQLANPALMPPPDPNQPKKRIKAIEAYTGDGSQPPESYLDPALLGNDGSVQPGFTSGAGMQAAKVPHKKKKKDDDKPQIQGGQGNLGYAYAAGMAPNRRNGVGFYEDDMLFGGVEGSDSEDEDYLGKSPETQQLRALTKEMQSARIAGPRAPTASDHLARIDLTLAPPTELSLPPIPPIEMATRDFPIELYLNSNLVLEHAAANPMNFDHPWAALSQLSKLRPPSNRPNGAGPPVSNAGNASQPTAPAKVDQNIDAALDPALLEAGGQGSGSKVGDIQVFPAKDISVPMLT